MSKQVCHVALATEAGTRLDALLANRGLYASRSAAARAIEEGRVLVAGAAVPKRHAVAAGEPIVCELDDPPDELPVYGEPIDLDVRYEDDALLVLSKQAGLVCHPTPDHAHGTLVNALIWHCGEDHLCNVQGEDDRLGIVHRLDRDTTGLMLAAKTDEAGAALMEAIRLRMVDRHYLALVHGVVAPDTGMVDAPIARAVQERTRMAVRDGAGSREAITTFSVLERFEPGPHDAGYTLVDCKLFTGRTHQIRVHMSHIGHPLLNDARYGGDVVLRGERSAAYNKFVANCFALCPRQALHARTLGFVHPVTRQEMFFSSDVPSDMTAMIDRWRTYAAGRGL